MSTEVNIFSNSAEKEGLEETHFQCKRIVEALLFASSDSVSVEQLCVAISCFGSFSTDTIREILAELAQEYLQEKRSFYIAELAGAFVLRTYASYAVYIEKLRTHRQMEKLSPAATEVLAIIAYRQPITRPGIDAIRGVDSSGVLHVLLERELVEVVGHANAPGRPQLLSVTKRFLEHFGLKDLQDLPKASL